MIVEHFDCRMWQIWARTKTLLWTNETSWISSNSDFSSMANPQQNHRHTNTTHQGKTQAMKQSVNANHKPKVICFDWRGESRPEARRCRLTLVCGMTCVSHPVAETPRWPQLSHAHHTPHAILRHTTRFVFSLKPAIALHAVLLVLNYMAASSRWGC